MQHASTNGFIVSEDHDLRAVNYVVIRHTNGIESIYCELINFLLRYRDLIFASDRITISGTTGKTTIPHLHFTNKVHRKFIDPKPLLRRLLVTIMQMHQSLN